MSLLLLNSWFIFVSGGRNGALNYAFGDSIETILRLLKRNINNALECSNTTKWQQVQTNFR